MKKYNCREICERAFHSDLGRYKRHRRKVNCYFIGGTKARAEKEYYGLLFKNIRNKVVLDLGCGFGDSSFLLVQRGARKCIGTDISDSMVNEARKKYAHSRISFYEMSCEDLDFPDNSFDLVCGKAILHHVNIQKVLREIKRILRPDGIAIFLEPLGHNPLVNLFRKLTPKSRSPLEKPLTEADIELCKKHFRVDHKEFVFTLIPLLVFRKMMPSSVFSFIYKASNEIDEFLLNKFGEIYKFYWMSLLVLRKQ